MHRRQIEVNMDAVAAPVFQVIDEGSERFRLAGVLLRRFNDLVPVEVLPNETVPWNSLNLQPQVRTKFRPTPIDHIELDCASVTLEGERGGATLLLPMFGIRIRQILNVNFRSRSAGVPLVLFRFYRAISIQEEIWDYTQQIPSDLKEQQTAVAVADAFEEEKRFQVLCGGQQRDFIVIVSFHDGELVPRLYSNGEITEIRTSNEGSATATLVFFALEGVRNIKGYRAPAHRPSQLMIAVVAPYLARVANWFACIPGGIEDCPLLHPPIGQPNYSSPFFVDILGEGMLSPRLSYWNHLYEGIRKIIFVGLPARRILGEFLSLPRFVEIAIIGEFDSQVVADVLAGLGCVLDRDTRPTSGWLKEGRRVFVCHIADWEHDKAAAEMLILWMTQAGNPPGRLFNNVQMKHRAEPLPALPYVNDVQFNIVSLTINLQRGRLPVDSRSRAFEAWDLLDDRYWLSPWADLPRTFEHGPDTLLTQLILKGASEYQSLVFMRDNLTDDVRFATDSASLSEQDFNDLVDFLGGEFQVGSPEEKDSRLWRRSQRERIRARLREGRVSALDACIAAARAVDRFFHRLMAGVLADFTERTHPISTKVPT